MADFSSINATVNWNRGPRIDVYDSSCNYFALNINQLINNKWCSIHEDCNFKPFHFFKSNFRFRATWKIKIWKWEDSLIQVFESTYDETNKNICIHFKGDNYEAHKLWLLKSIKLSIDYEFILHVTSKFASRLKNDFKNASVSIHSEIKDYESFEKKYAIYASYIIDRKEILTKTANWWESDSIFLNHSFVAKSWDHKRDWIGMNDEEIYNNIIGI
jgi:hypothetical protein